MPDSKIKPPDSLGNRPGTRQRVEQYAQRAARGEDLFQPGDLSCRPTRSESVWGEVPRPIVMMPVEDDEDE